ncbi:unnamed protein product, partial [Effrenium voratum]
MALVFVASDGRINACWASTPDIIDVNTMSSDFKPSTEQLLSLSKSALESIMTTHLGYSLKKKNGTVTKPDLAEQILKDWNKLMENLRAKFGTACASGSVSEFPRSGFCRLRDELKDEKGFVLTCLQGSWFIQTKRGIIEPDDDLQTFLLKHNVLIFRDEDYVAELAEQEEEEEEEKEEADEAEASDHQSEEGSHEKIAEEIQPWTDDNECALKLLTMLNSRPGMCVNPDEYERLKQKKLSAQKLEANQGEYDRLKATLEEENLWDRTVLLKLTITKDDGQMQTQYVPMEFGHTTSISDVREKVALVIESEDFVLFHEGKKMSENYRRVMEYDVKNNKVIDVEMFKKAYEIYQKAETTNDISLTAFLDGLSLPDMERLNTYLSHDKAQTEKKIMTIATYDANLAVIDQMITALQEMKAKASQVVAEAVVSEATDDKGEFKLVQLKEMVRVSLA